MAPCSPPDFSLTPRRAAISLPTCSRHLRSKHSVPPQTLQLPSQHSACQNTAGRPLDNAPASLNSIGTCRYEGVLAPPQGAPLPASPLFAPGAFRHWLSSPRQCSDRPAPCAHLLAPPLPVGLNRVLCHHQRQVVGSPAAHWGDCTRRRACRSFHHRQRQEVSSAAGCWGTHITVTFGTYSPHPGTGGAGVEQESWSASSCKS